MRRVLAEWTCNLTRKKKGRTKKKHHKMSESGATGRHSLLALSSYVLAMKFKGVILNGFLTVSN